MDYLCPREIHQRVGAAIKYLMVKDHRVATKLKLCLETAKASSKLQKDGTRKTFLSGSCGHQACPLCCKRYWRRRAKAIYERVRMWRNVCFVTLTVPQGERDAHGPDAYLSNMRAIQRVIPQEFVAFPHWGNREGRFVPHYHLFVRGPLNWKRLVPKLRSIGLGCELRPVDELAPLVAYVIRPEPNPWVWWRPGKRVFTSKSRTDSILLSPAISLLSVVLENGSGSESIVLGEGENRAFTRIIKTIGDRRCTNRHRTYQTGLGGPKEMK